MTVCTRRSLPSALVLADSFRREQGASAECLAIVADEDGDPAHPGGAGLRVVPARALELPDFGSLAGRHAAPELARALVPFALRALGPPCVFLAADAEVLAPVAIPAGGVGVVARGGGEPPLVDDGFVGLAAAADEMLGWWEERIRWDGTAHPWLDVALGLWPEMQLLTGPPSFLAGWNVAGRAPARSGTGLTVDDRPVAWVRFDGLDPEAPDLGGAAPEVRAALRELVDRHEGELARNAELARPPGYVTAADGSPLDDRLRRLLARAARDGALSAGPFDPSGWTEARRWLCDPDPDPRSGGVGRYVYDIYRERGDLQTAYPRLEEPEDRDGLHGWMIVHGSEQHDIPAVLLPDPPPGLGLEDRADGPRLPWGVNVAGYFQSDVGVGEAARRVMQALDRANVPALPVHGTDAPPSRRGTDYGSVPAAGAPFAANLVCVNADGLPAFARDVGPGFFGGRLSIGLWWWELLDFPPEYHRAFAHVDEVWVGSLHVLEAISAVSPVPVVRLPLPVTVPPVEPASREELGLPDGFVFLFVFDFNSVMRRKNPVGLIDAFSRAFAPGEGPQLVVKSINGDRHPRDRGRLEAAAARREDVHLVDRYLGAGERDAMIASCDAYVSLHRSEGFGLTLAEAMHLGRPVIATGYSGNLEFMDAETAWLVPYRLERVGAGAAPYPAEASWAEPDLDAAAAAMRHVVAEPEEAATRARHAAAAIRRTHSPEAAGAAMAARLETLRPRIEDRVRTAGVAARRRPAPRGVRTRLAAARGALRGRGGAASAPVRAGSPETERALALYAALLARTRRQESRIGALERELRSARGDEPGSQGGPRC